MTCRDCIYFERCMREAYALGNDFDPDFPSDKCEEFKKE